jgi:cytochrome bd-type quinol oxidase subunit 2
MREGEAPGDRPDGDRADAGRAGGAGRVLVAVYGVFALAAGARAAVQLSTRFAEAPLAYLLSALAAVIYVVATVALARGGRAGRRVALVAISVELVGVLVVGTLSLVDPAAFPDETVWSAYGRGYVFVPLVLPVLGLALLLRPRRSARESAQKSPPPPKSPPPEANPPP